MKLSDLPQLIFIDKNGWCYELLPPPANVMWENFYIGEFLPKEFPCGPFSLSRSHPAHAFFASQISLEDYHTS